MHFAEARGGRGTRYIYAYDHYILSLEQQKKKKKKKKNMKMSNNDEVCKRACFFSFFSSTIILKGIINQCSNCVEMIWGKRDRGILLYTKWSCHRIISSTYTHSHTYNTHPPPHFVRNLVAGPIYSCAARGERGI